MAGSAVLDVTTTWLHALLFRWPDHQTPADAGDLDELRAALGRVGVELTTFGAPDGAGVTTHGPAVHVETVAEELERLVARGVGPGLIGAIGPLPGLPARVVRSPGGFDALRAAAEAQLALRDDRRVPEVDRDPLWTLELPGDDPLLLRVDETLCTLADGQYGTRGELEQDGPGSDGLVVASGTYMPSSGLGVDATPTLLPGPIWTRLVTRPQPGYGSRRILDLRTGILLREDGGDPPLRTIRFVCLAHPGTGVLRAEGPADALSAGPALVLPDDMTGEVQAAPPAWTASTSAPRATITARAVQSTHTYGARLVVDRRATLTRAGVAGVPPDRSDGDVHERDFTDLLDEQRAAWARRWERADVTIEGDDRLQVAVRFALFHLMSSVTDVGEAAVGARGLSGRAYRGHVFWDADVFVLPFLAATHPPAARAMLDYRVARLPAARTIAAQAGRHGARFPWESADDGMDVTPTSAIGLDGRLEPIRTGGLQEHITADVAWAAAHYLDWTGDGVSARHRATPLLFETARYWRSRITYDAAGRAHLLGVMGPDEYHFPVDDNAFTNGIVRFNLRRGASMVPASASAQLRREASGWRRLADDLVDGYDGRTGHHEQFVGYDALEPMLISDLAEPPVAADILLGRQRIAGTQLIKQADVLMLHQMLPFSCPPGSLVRDLDHYLPRTAHGSSLSPGVHAGLLARAGRPDDALPLLELAAYMDLDDVTGSTAGGLHLATAGSLWQALAFGFLGLWPRRQGMLQVDPVLPSSWDALTVRVTFRQHPFVFRAEHGRLFVRCVRSTTLQVGRRRHRVSPPVTVFRRDGTEWRVEER